MVSAATNRSALPFSSMNCRVISAINCLLAVWLLAMALLVYVNVPCLLCFTDSTFFFDEIDLVVATVLFWVPIWKKKLPKKSMKKPEKHCIYEGFSLTRHNFAPKISLKNTASCRSFWAAIPRIPLYSSPVHSYAWQILGNKPNYIRPLHTPLEKQHTEIWSFVNKTKQHPVYCCGQTFLRPLLSAPLHWNSPHCS